MAHSAQQSPAVLEVTEVRVRWVGHRLLADDNIAVKSDRSVEQGHKIAHGGIGSCIICHTLAMPRFISTLPRRQANSIIGSAIMSMTNYRRIHTNH